MALTKADKDAIAAMVAESVGAAVGAIAQASQPAQETPQDKSASTKARATSVTPVVSLKGITGSGVFVATTTTGGKNGDPKPYKDGPRVRISLTNRMGAPYTAATLPWEVFVALHSMTKADFAAIETAIDEALPAWEALQEAQEG